MISEIKKGSGFNFFSELGGAITLRTRDPQPLVLSPQNIRLSHDATSGRRSITSSWKEMPCQTPIIESAVFTYHVSCKDHPDGLRDASAPELELVVFEETSIYLRSLADISLLHHAPNGKYFTVCDMIAAVCTQELATRSQTDWFGGIDDHHIFFEGVSIKKDPDGQFVKIHWGS